MQTLDLGNNETISQGMRKHRDMYLAMTYTQSKWFATERGAIKWLERRGLKPNGSRI